MGSKRPPQLDPEVLNRLRIVLSRVARALNRSTAAAGLSPTQALIFTAIGRRGPIGLSALAESENVNASMLSRVVAKLEGAGLVERLPDPDDGRAFIVRHTEAGRAMHRRLKEERGRWLEERLVLLEPGKVDQLLTALPALEDLAAALQERQT